MLFKSKSAQSLAPLLVALSLAPAMVEAQSVASDYTYATRYDAMGGVTGTIAPDPDGSSSLKFAAVRNTYDAAGRLTKVETGELSNWISESVAPSAWGLAFTVLSRVETTYDAMDRKIKEVARGSDGVSVSVTQYSYDSVGRLKCTAVRMDSSQWNSQSNACVPQTNGPNGPDRITKNIYDAAGQLLQVRKAVGTGLEQAYVTYTYTGNGKQKNVIDANGNKAELRYDGFDRQIAWIFPSKITTGSVAACNLGSVTEVNGISGPNGAYASGNDCEKYFYDKNGNRAKLMKRDGSTLTYTYDALDRMTRKVVSDRIDLAPTHERDVFYGYDTRGLPTYARFDSASGEGVTNGYDGFGRLTSAAVNMNGQSRELSFLYDKDGNRTRTIWPDNAYTTMEFDVLDRLHAVKNSSAEMLVEPAYNNRGLPSAVNRLNSAYDQTLGYDTVGRLQSLTITSGVSASRVNWSYTRNPASQIASETRNNDAYAWSGHVNVDRNYSVNGLNQYTAAGSALFCYDDNGNLTADGSSVYKYDVENRLVEKRAQTNTNCELLSYSGTLQASLRYDPLGRLYETVAGSNTTRFLYDGDALVGEYNAGGTLLRRYVHGNDVGADDPLIWFEGTSTQSNNARYVYADARGSIVLTGDASGNSLGINSYDEYGIPGSANQGRFQYTGQASLPEIGMYYYKARIYSPTLGRFLQTDPIGYDDQITLYAYVANDPVNGVDDTGEQRRPPRPYQSLGAIHTQAQATAAQRGLQNVVPGYRVRASFSSRNPSARAYASQYVEVRADYQALSIIGFGPLNNQSRAGEGIGNSNRAVGRIQQAFEGVRFDRASSPGTYNFQGGMGGIQAAESFAQSLGGAQTGSTGTGSVYTLSGLPSGTTGTVSTYQSGNGYARATVRLETTVTESGSIISRKVTNEFKVRFDN